MVTKKFGVDFDSSGGALTLPTEYVLDEKSRDINWNMPVSRTHKNDWTITGKIQEDHYTWVSEFIAKHPKFGRVWGNFEDEVYADSQEGFEDFYKNFPPEPWDYADI